jgi:hypothetical protein
VRAGRRDSVRALFGSLARAAVGLSCGATLAACGGPPVVDAPALPDCSPPTIRDPEFLTGGAWTVTGSAALTTGAATFTTATMCDHGGIAQRLETPPVECVRPLVLTVRYALEDGDRLNFAAGVDGGWNAALLSNSGSGARLSQTCLGAGLFAGGDATLFLGAGPNPALCPAHGGEELSLVLAHVSIDVDATDLCPIPGRVRNGDFEAGATGWTFAQRGGAATIEAGAGEGGSFAAHLHTEHLCETPTIRGTVSLPTPKMVPHPALRFWMRGTSNAFASVRIGAPPPAVSTGVTTLVGTNEAIRTSLCLPRWAQGTVQPLELALVDAQYTQRCATDSVRDFAFDDFELVSEPACADANVLDPGFEQAALARAPAPTWSIERYDDVPGSLVEMRVDPTFAHTGKVAAVLSTTTPCPRASVAADVTLARPSGAAGPAVSFWYKAGPGTNTRLEVSLSALVGPVTLPVARPQAWTRARACLDPHLAGRPDLLRFSIVSETGGTCADTFAAETFAIDDVALTTDPECSAR